MKKIMIYILIAVLVLAGSVWFVTDAGNVKMRGEGNDQEKTQDQYTDERSSKTEDPLTPIKDNTSTKTTDPDEENDQQEESGLEDEDRQNTEVEENQNTEENDLENSDNPGMQPDPPKKDEEKDPELPKNDTEEKKPDPPNSGQAEQTEDPNPVPGGESEEEPKPSDPQSSGWSNAKKARVAFILDTNPYLGEETAAYYADIFAQVADASGFVDAETLMGIARIESCFDSNAVSWTGEHYGLMQLHYSYEAQYGYADGQLFDPYCNVECACKLLRHCYDYYGGNLDYAVIAYNMGTCDVNNPYRYYVDLVNDFAQQIRNMY